VRDPVAIWLCEQGIDAQAAVEAFAIVLLLVVLYGAALSFGRAL
jgi:hypothetical protein